MSEHSMQHRPPARADKGGGGVAIAGPAQAKLAQLASALSGGPAQLAKEDELQMAKDDELQMAKDEELQMAKDDELQMAAEEEEPAQMAGVPINDDPALEAEADRMGDVAMRHGK